MPAAVPRSLSEWLESELDKKLASLPSNNARYGHLVLCANAWALKYTEFVKDGTQPFNEPHPVHGDMDAFDFTVLLASIESRKIALIRRAKALS